mgnify:FL=1
MKFEVPKQRTMIRKIPAYCLEAGYKIADRNIDGRYCVVESVERHPNDARIVVLSVRYPEEGLVRLFVEQGNDQPVIFPYQEEWRPSES